MNNNSEEYQNRKKLALEAYEKGCVIFSPQSQRFYTPREFIDSDEIVTYKMVGMSKFSNCGLMEPKYAIAKKLEVRNRAEIDFKDFMERMMKAFELHPKGK
ncbi:hypothetical protein [Pedobacter antarcticus]|uniref:hypothetical protein n=1 Tax=Pedobacter antarcticus TaxID=34086 RepID=UPI002930ACCF|nr:hypothetical protein [Pedobacter antarcticus]